MALKILSTDKLAMEGGVKIAVMGGPKVGKTRLAGTTGGKTLILSAERGLLSLREHSIDAIEISGIDELEEAHDFLTKSKEGQQYEWVCLDSLSEIAEICLSEEKRKRNDGRAAYGNTADHVVDLVRKFRDLQRNVYMIAKLEQQRVDNRLLYRPMMPGQKLGPALPYLFDEIFALRTWREENDDGEETVRRVLQTFNDGEYECGDRSGALDSWEEADLSVIAAKILKRAGRARPEEEDG